MSEDKYVCCVLLSDVHLSDKAPIARSVEPDWRGAMARQWDEVKELSEKHGGVPIIVGGDLFDRWNPSVELVNWAIRSMPHIYAVPGQHDLPNHQLSEIIRSAYYTLVEANKVKHLCQGCPVEVPGRQPLRLWGFPWGVPIKPVRKKHDMILDVAVCHSYIYNSKTGYPGAPKDKHLRSYREVLSRYDAALFGDNHIRTVYNLQRQNPGPSVFNPGSFYRRKMDEIEHRPCVGLLYNDGTIDIHSLNTEQDKFLSAEDLPSVAASGIGFETFVEELSQLGDSAINFSAAIRQLLEREKTPERVKEIILRILEKSS